MEIECKKRKLNDDILDDNTVTDDSAHKDETDELYDEARTALFLAQEANKKALEVAQRLQYHVKDELSNIALQDLNSCVESCQNASQLIEESRSRRNETGLIDL